MNPEAGLFARLQAELASQRPGSVFPKFGILATIVGTITAMLLVPDSFEEAGDLRRPAWALLMGLLLAPAVAVFRDLRSLVRAENVLAVAPVYWLLLDLVQARYGISIAEKDDVVKAFAATGLFSIGIWVAALRRPWRLPSFADSLSRRELTPGKTFFIAVGCFMLGVFYFVYMAGFDLQVVLESLTKTRWEAAWTRTRLEGGWEAFVEHLMYFGMLLPALAVTLGRKTGWFKPPTIACWLMTLAYALFQVQGGNRRYLGVMFGAAIVVWLISEKKPRVVHYLAIAASAAAMLFFMEFVLKYRGEGIEMLTEVEEGESLVDMSTIRVDDNFLRLAQSIHYVPALHSYVWHEYAFMALVRPIPRVLWPGKPKSFGFQIHDYIQIGASLSSSVVGELYVSGGLLVVFFGGWLYGRLGVWGTGLLMPPRTMPRNILYGAWLMALFAGIRSMTDFVMMTYVVLALIAILWLFRRGLQTVPDPAAVLASIARKPGIRNA
jgi:hypothetical protein